jgi:hypothetical protein
MQTTTTTTGTQATVHLNSVRARLVQALVRQGYHADSLQWFDGPSLVRVALRPLCGERALDKVTVRAILTV